MKTTTTREPRTVYRAIVIILWVLILGLHAGAEDWKRRDVDLQAGGDMRIKGIRYPEGKPLPMRGDRPERPTPGTRALFSTMPTGMTALGAEDEMLVESPPIDGFIPWIAVTVTKERRAELEFEADVQSYVKGSFPSGVNPDTDFIVGLFDTGASAHVMGYGAGVMAGLYSGGMLTASETVVSGVTGSVVASVSQPLGIYIDGLSAIDAETMTLDRSNMMGESNVAIMVGQNPGPLPDLPTAIGSPMSVYYTTLIRNDRPLTVERDGEQFTAPDIELYETDDPEAPSFTNVIPLELRPLGGISVQYVPTLDMGLGGLDFGDILGGGSSFGSDFPPASPSVIIGNSSQSLFFVHSVDLRDGEKSAVDKDRFMLDTGAQVTVVGSRIAARLQLDPGAPEFEAEIEGVTGDITMAPGYYVDSLEIPALGQWFRATNVPVILLDISSPEGGTLDGIIGMNLFSEFNLIVRGGGLFLQGDPSLELQRIGASSENQEDTTSESAQN